MSDEKNLKKDEIFEPSNKVKKKAIVKEYDQQYEESITNREEYWAKQAKSLKWYKKWDMVLDEQYCTLL